MTIAYKKIAYDEGDIEHSLEKPCPTQSHEALLKDNQEYKVGQTNQHFSKDRQSNTWSAATGIY